MIQTYIWIYIQYAHNAHPQPHIVMSVWIYLSSCITICPRSATITQSKWQYYVLHSVCTRGASSLHLVAYPSQVMVCRQLALRINQNSTYTSCSVNWQNMLWDCWSERNDAKAATATVNYCYCSFNRHCRCSHHPFCPPFSLPPPLLRWFCVGRVVRQPKVPLWPLCDTLVIFAYEMCNKNTTNPAFLCVCSLWFIRKSVAIILAVAESTNAPEGASTVKFYNALQC